MIGKMLFRGTVLVVGLITTNAVIEKFEKAELKRKAKSKNKDSKKEVEITEEELKQAFETAIEMADKMEAEVVK